MEKNEPIGKHTAEICATLVLATAILLAACSGKDNQAAVSPTQSTPVMSSSQSFQLINICAAPTNPLDEAVGLVTMASEYYTATVDVSGTMIDVVTPISISVDVELVKQIYDLAQGIK